MKKLYKYQVIGAIALFVLIATLVSAGCVPNTTEAAEPKSYYVAEWIWDDSDKDFEYWRTPYPSVTAGLIDMRTLPQMAEPGPGSQCCMLLALTEPRIDASLTPLGNDLDKIVALATKTALETRLRINDPLPTGTLRDTIYELLMFRADPTGQTAWKPLMPGSDRRIKVNFGPGEPLTIRQTGPLSPEWSVIREVLRTDFVGIKADSLARGDELYRKVLAVWELKYGVKASEIIPGETALKPATIITDNFNRSDANVLGTGPEAWSWTSVVGTWGIRSNKAEQLSGVTDSARAESDLSSDDHYAEAIISSTWVNLVDFTAVAVRYNAAANSMYVGGNANSSADAFQIIKVTAGTPSELTTPAGTIDPTATIKLEINGSNLELFSESISVATATDGTFTGQTRTGMYGIDTGGASTTNNWDDFEAADLAISVRRIFIIADGRRRRTLIEDVEEFLKKEREKVGQGSET